MRHAKHLMVVLALITISTGIMAAPRVPIDHEPALQKIIRIIKGLLPTPHDATEMSVPHP
jgi:hypothetical protein